MAGFLYYLPTDAGGAVGPDLTAIEAAGLGYAFERRPVARRVHPGPDNMAGWVLADDESVGAAKTLYDADVQHWRKIPGLEAWIGRYRDQPIAPNDLARTNQLGGHLVTLADGREWLVPIARATADDGWYCALPQTSKFDDAGTWIRGDVVERYRPLWKLAVDWDAAVYAAVVEAGLVDAAAADSAPLILQFENLHTAAVVALAANYRLSDVEAAELELLTERICCDVLNAVVDLPTRVELIKKKQSPPAHDG